MFLEILEENLSDFYPISDEVGVKWWEYEELELPQVSSVDLQVAILDHGAILVPCHGDDIGDHCDDTPSSPPIVGRQCV